MFVHRVDGLEGLRALGIGHSQSNLPEEGKRIRPQREIETLQKEADRDAKERSPMSLVVEARRLLTLLLSKS